MQIFKSKHVTTLLKIRNMCGYKDNTCTVFC